MLGGIFPSSDRISPVSIKRRLDYRSVIAYGGGAIARAIAVRWVRLYAINENPVVVIDVVFEVIPRSQIFLAVIVGLERASETQT